MKQCTKCGQIKPLSDFWKDRSKKHGYGARCKACKVAIYNQYRKANGYDKKRYWKNPNAEQERHLIRKYGITLADYNEMFQDQGGKCGVCALPHGGSRRFDVDHCHATGVVRGLLCTNCNRMIGHANDRPETLRAAACYLESSRKSPPRSSARSSKRRASE